MSQFVMSDQVRRESFDWGTIGWRVVPATGARRLVVMDVTLNPGGGHNFHRHPGQEELIVVERGEIVQFIERQPATLGPGDSVFLDEGVVHASFNDSDRPAELRIAIGPSLGGETGYGIEEVADQEPWRTLHLR